MKETAMKRTRIASIWAITAGAIVALLGICHNLGTMSVYHDFGFDQIPAGHGFIYMFAGVGTAWIFVGLTLIACGRGLPKGASWAWPLGFASAVLMLLFGVGAVLIIPDAPTAPLILGCSLPPVVPFLMQRRPLLTR
jgi:hypothetical protein